ncbi:MORN repeat-containing protein [Brumimicrobium mesophilum]|uniref:MORN repeat-containing protein n=1 Tax=Brumimicrobium mesophilum TaxID=392717 RepID=UPI000D142954|nr:hypothetical protein [Brumimicrobium mesophilum]
MTTSKSNSKKRVFKYLFWGYLVISGILFYIIFQNGNSEIKEVRNEIVNNQLMIDSLKADNDFKSDLMKADKYFIEGKYDTASLFYNKIEKEYINKAIPSNIALRKSRVVEVNSVRDSMVNSLNTYISSYDNATHDKDSLLSKIELLETIYSTGIVKLENEIRNLQLINVEKEEQLANKVEKEMLTFVNGNGNSIFYLGEVKNEKANGFGIGIFNTGGVYKGDWKNNKRHGKGSYNWKDGHRYIGEYINDEREGQGTYMWENGEKYVGGWKSNKRNGIGILYNKNGKIIYEGNWDEGSMMSLK